MLEIRDLSVRYGHHRALENVSLAVDKGEICVILGANGAGKSTLLKAVAGIVPTEPGATISMNGVAITGSKPHHIVERGVALVPEGRGIFGDLTVAENLQLGAHAKRARAEERHNLELIFELFPKLAERRRQVARTMSGGEQQMVAIGRALMSSPEILMLDEPSLGLSPLLCGELFKSLKRVGAAGVGILLVEQNARQSLAIADRGYLLENGHITGENKAMALAADPAVRKAFLGGAAGGEGGRPRRLPVIAPGARNLNRILAELAERAAAIQADHIRRLRLFTPMPSAFVRRLGVALSGPVGDLGAMAAELARRAADIQADHIRQRRQASSRPSGFAGDEAETAPGGQVSDGSIDLDQMTKELARRAAEIQSAHIASLRVARGPTGPDKETAAPKDGAKRGRKHKSKKKSKKSLV